MGVGAWARRWSVGRRRGWVFYLSPALSLRIKNHRSGDSPLTLSDVDGLLNQLAAHSPHSQHSQTVADPEPQTRTLETLYLHSCLSPYALSVLTQLILRDLRPLLSPLPGLRVPHPTALLRINTTHAPAQLGLIEALRVYDPSLAEAYLGGIGDVGVCADRFEHGDSGSLGPVVGVNVQVSRVYSQADRRFRSAGKADQ